MRLSLLFFLLVQTTALFATGNPHQLHYTLRSTYPEKGSRLLVKLELQTFNQSSTTLFVPSVWGQESSKELFRWLKVKGGSLAISADSSEITIRHKPGQKLLLSYVFADKSGMEPSFSRGNVYCPAVRSSYLSFFTNSVLFAVKDEVYPYSDCSINVKGLQQMYPNLVSSFGKPDEKGMLYLENVRNEELQNGILVAGDYRIHETKTHTGQLVTLAIRDSWPFSDEDLNGLIRRTIDQQRTFWNDFSQPNFLITVSSSATANPMDQSYTGTGLYNSFAVNATNGQRTTVESLAYLFYHELMHHWIGGTILNAADEELSYWFSEGFTDYFTRVNMLESTEIDEAGYYELADSVFRAHYSDKRLDYHNDSIRVHFWDDSYLGKLPYNRGSLFAMLLDSRIRHVTEGKASLKTVMQQMLVQAKATESGMKQFHHTWLEAEVKKIAGLEIGPWIDEYIIAGKPVPMSLFNESMPRKLSEKRCKVFGFGLSLEKDPASGVMKILEISPESGAAAADFKVGDLIRGYSVYMQPDSDSQILVERDGKETWIDFHPFEWRTVPQFAD